jgi:hypothetical protein
MRSNHISIMPGTIWLAVRDRNHDNQVLLVSFGLCLYSSSLEIHSAVTGVVR